MPAPVFGQDIVTAIIGEAAGQTTRGQMGVACAIKNRPEGLQGVYGKDMTRTPSPLEIRNARKALRGAMPDVCYMLIHGADMFCSDTTICNEKWKNVPMVFIIKIDDFSFYRRLKSKTKGRYYNESTN